MPVNFPEFGRYGVISGQEQHNRKKASGATKYVGPLTREYGEAASRSPTSCSYRPTCKRK